MSLASFWSKVTKILKSNWKSILAFLLLTIVILVFSVWVLTSLARDDAEKRTLMISIVSGFASNSIFFLVFGFLFAIFVSTDPSRLNLSSRLGLIFSSSNATDPALAYVLEEVKKIGAILKKVTVHVTFSELANQQKIIRIDVQKTGLISNMFHRENYTQDLTVGITPDPIDAPPNSVWGEIVSASYTFVDDKGDPIMESFGKAEKATSQKRVAFSTSINIPPNKTLSFSTNSWFWQLLDQPVWWRFRQYAESAEFKLENNSEVMLKIAPTGNTSAETLTPLPEPVHLKPGETHTFTASALPPTVKIEVVPSIHTNC